MTNTKYTRATREDCQYHGIRFPDAKDHHNVLVKMKDDRTLLQKLMLKDKPSGLEWVAPELVQEPMCDYCEGEEAMPNRSVCAGCHTILTQ